MKIIFCYQLPTHVDPYKNDGLAEALRLLSENHKVLTWNIDLYGAVQLPVDADFYLAWGGALSPATALVADLAVPKSKKGLCWGGCGVDQYKEAPLDKFGVVFVESEKDSVLRDNFRFAFGTNTRVYKPLKLKKAFDAIYVGAIVGYKRQELFVQATSNLNALLVGELGKGPDDIEPIKNMQTLGWLHVPYVTPETANALVNLSSVSVITANEVGGSQRFMLESLAANVPVIIMKDAPYLVEIANYFPEGVRIVDPNPEAINQAIKETKESKTAVKTRETVLEKFSEFKYADALERGIYAQSTV